MKSILLFLYLFIINCTSHQAESPPEPSDFSKVDTLVIREFAEEGRITRYLEELSDSLKPENIAIINANILSFEEERFLEGKTILISNGLITEIGETALIEIPEGYRVINGAGKYLTPGLTDMHVHTTGSNVQKLLHVVNGVTSVREMAGQPWMISLREKISNNHILAPTMYIGSTMINTYSLGIYTSRVETIKEAREKVRQHKKTGFDYIKIWNNLSEDIFLAVAHESKEVGLPLVGHIPAKVPIHVALDHMHTIEHFKQYVDNGTGEITDADYVDLTRGFSGYFCPTFYTHRTSWRGERAERFFMGKEAEFVSKLELYDWKEEIHNPAFDQSAEMSVKVFQNSSIVFKNLTTVTDNFITGTDSGGGYMFMVPGFALYEEMEHFRSNGLSHLETLKAATLRSAKALKATEQMGSVEIGKRADLLLFDVNPLESELSPESLNTVFLRGIVMDRALRSEIENKIVSIRKYYDQKSIDIMAKDIGELYPKISHKELLKPHYLMDMSKKLESMSFVKQAAVIDSLFQASDH